MWLLDEKASADFTRKCTAELYEGHSSWLSISHRQKRDWGLYSVSTALQTLPRPLERLFINIHTSGCSCWILTRAHSRRTHLRYHRSPSPNSRPQIPERGHRHRGSFLSSITVVATTFRVRKKKPSDELEKEKSDSLSKILISWAPTHTVFHYCSLREEKVKESILHFR